MKIDLSKLSVEEFSLISDSLGGFSSEVLDVIKPNAFGFDFWQLTLFDFGEIAQNRVSPTIENYLKSSNAAEFIAKNKAFENFMVDFSGTIDKFSPKQSADERAASAACPNFLANEGFLVFVLDYFKLKSFSEAEKVTLADLYLAKKAAYISATFSRTLNELQNNKIKSKR